jgi:hypothetical protein
MNERTVQSVASEFPPPPAQAPGWDAFETSLAAALSVLEEEFLVVSAKVGNRFVQFNVCPEEGVFAETVSNAYLGPEEKLDAGQLAELLSLGWAAPTHAPDSPDPIAAPKGSPNHFREFPRPYSCADVARFAVRTLTGPLHVASPADLEYKAFDDEGHPVTLPSLPIERLPLPPLRAKAPVKPRGPTELDRLRAKVLAAARAGTGQGSLAYDDDGALHVPVGNRMGWIRPYERPQYVRVHIHLLSDVEGGEELLAQIHDVNSRLPVVRVIYRNRSLFLGVDFPALPFRAEHLTQAVMLLAQFADDVLEELRLPAEPGKVQN